MSTREKTGVIATAPPADELPIEWPNVGLGMRPLTGSEAASLARQFMEDGTAIVAYDTINVEGDLVVRYLLPQSGGETTAILSPVAAQTAGGWAEIHAIIERI